MTNEFNHRKATYTDENGVKHSVTIHDRMPGKNGFTGIIHNVTKEFEFVEDESIEIE